MSNDTNVDGDFLLKHHEQATSQHTDVQITSRSILWPTNSSSAVLLGTGAPYVFFSGADDTAFSISMWIKPIAHNTDATQQLFAKGNFPSSARREYELAIDTSKKFKFILWDESTNGYIGQLADSANADSFLNAWHNIVATYDASEDSDGIKIYIDGSLLATSASESGTYNGMDQSAGAYYAMIGAASVKGYVCETSLWNKELSADEAGEIYGVGSPRTLTSHSAKANLVAWWRLGSHASDAIDGGGSSSADNRIIDESGNAKHGVPASGFNGEGDFTGVVPPAGTANTIPFLLSCPGVTSLRGRTTAYSCSIG